MSRTEHPRPPHFVPDDPKDEIGSFDRPCGTAPAPRPRTPTPPPELHIGIGGWQKCKSCPAQITFATGTSGKPAPFVSDPKGLWTIVNGQARYLGKDAEQLELGQKPAPRFTNHFASCPGAASWRNRDR